MTFRRRPKDPSNRQRPPGQARRSTSAAASSKECKLHSTRALSHDSLTSMTRWDASTMAPTDNANNAAGQYPSQDSKPFRTPGCVWRVNKTKRWTFEVGNTADRSSARELNRAGIHVAQGWTAACSQKPGPVEPASYSSIGTRFSAHACSTGVTMRHASSASSPRTDNALSPANTSSNTRLYGGSADRGGFPVRTNGVSWYGGPATARFSCSLIASSSYNPMRSPVRNQVRLPSARRVAPPTA